MGARESLQKLLDRKQAELVGLEQQIRDLKIYIQAIQDSVKILPKDPSTVESEQKNLRSGSALGLVQAFLKREGKPQHLSAILAAIGKENTQANRVSLTGSLGGYVRERRIFTRPAPNTFGLIEFGEDESTPDAPDIERDDIPEDFGR